MMLAHPHHDRQAVAVLLGFIVMIGVFYLNLFLGNLLVGFLGGLLGKMPATSFWLLHAGLVFTAAALLLLARSATLKLFSPTSEAATAA